MLTASYYRKQADICVRLARAAGSVADAARFKVLALNFLLKAANTEMYPDDVPAGSDLAIVDRGAA